MQITQERSDRLSGQMTIYRIEMQYHLLIQYHEIYVAIPWNTQRQLLPIIIKRKCKYFGHIVRQNTLQRQLLKGKINGKRSRGRQRATWMSNLKKWTGKSYGKLIRTAENPEQFRCIIFNVLKAFVGFIKRSPLIRS